MPVVSAFHAAEMPAEKAIAIIRAGLPTGSIKALATILGMPPGDLARKLNIPVRNLRIRGPKSRKLSPTDTEKLVRTARIHRLARKVFMTNSAVALWLRSPAGPLNGISPIDFIDTDTGAREVEALLLGIAHGNVI